MSESQNPGTNSRWELPKRGWYKKFAHAFVGLFDGIDGQRSFIIHLPVALLVILLAAFFGISLERWCLLLICIAMVISAELFNSGIELLCKSISSEYDENIRRALNIASGAVLVLSIFAALIGSLILGWAAVEWFYGFGGGQVLSS